MGPLRRWADVLIDTTSYSTNDLQQRIREQFAATAPQGDDGDRLRASPSRAACRLWPTWCSTCASSTIRTGTPSCASSPGPGRRGRRVHRARSRRSPGSSREIRDLLLELLPRYAAQGKSYVNIAFGCTGGRHRSVFVAERIAEALREGGFSPTVLHRNLGSRAADMIEGPHQP